MITIRNDSLSAEDIAKAEELQRRYVERTRREAIPNSPSSTLYVPVSTVLDQNEDFYKRRETQYSPQVTAGYLSTEIKTEEPVEVEEQEEAAVDLNALDGEEEDPETEEDEETEEEEESEEAVLI
jgi:hypothetical protein